MEGRLAIAELVPIKMVPIKIMSVVLLIFLRAMRLLAEVLLVGAAGKCQTQL